MQLFKSEIELKQQSHIIRTSGALMQAFHLLFSASKPSHFGISLTEKVKGFTIFNRRSLLETSHPQQLPEITA